MPLIYHFGGLSSVVPTELLDRIDFYPGNFSVKYGRLMGGIVDVALREPDTSCNGPYMVPTDSTGCYHGMAQVDLIDVRLMAQGPVPLLDDWSFAVAGRTELVRRLAQAGARGARRWQSPARPSTTTIRRSRSTSRAATRA